MSLKGVQIPPTGWAEEGSGGLECQGHTRGEGELVFISLDAGPLSVLLSLLEVALHLDHSLCLNFTRWAAISHWLCGLGWGQERGNDI